MHPAPTTAPTPLPNDPPASFAADLRAGLLVSLIALPLCLGIALASGFPPVAGIVTAIVGGLIATPLGSARLTIKGPAAGLIVIVIGAVTELGHGDLSVGYRLTLAVGVVAAALQILLALLRAATIGVTMSPSVVHGMLAAIGVTIVAKQAHTLVGVAPTGKGPLALLAEIPHSLAHANPEILAIGAAAMLVLFTWPLLRAPWAKKLPAPLVAVLVTVPLGLVFDLPHAHDYDFWSGHHHVGPEFLVTLPASLGDAIVWPDFAAAGTFVFWKYVLMFTLVGTIESTLSGLAVDSLDPERRASDLNRDLLATGAGNLLAASIGGLPMITEIVRSKANVDAGATSSRANFVHGLALLACIAVLADALHLIPLATLGAMLVYTGSRLASPRHFSHAWHIGPDQLLLFSTTLVVTLATDLLVGVGAGLALKVALHTMRGARLRDVFRTRFEADHTGDELYIRLFGAAAFPSLLPLRNLLADIDPGVRRVVVDLSATNFVDHTFLMRLDGIARELATAQLHVVGHESMRGSSRHPLSSRRRATR